MAAIYILGRVYEYFLGGFAGSEGKHGGEFYTPRSVVRVLVEMLEPYPNIHQRGGGLANETTIERNRWIATPEFGRLGPALRKTYAMLAPQLLHAAA